MKKIDRVDLYYNLIDKACMLLYKELNMNYLNALIRVSRDLTISFDDSLLEKGAIKKLEQIYEQIEQEDFVNEDIRLALELLVVKGLKHLNYYNLDVLTPDTLNYLFAFLVQELFDKKITILDITLKTGNMINCIANYISCESNLIGIEKESLLSEISRGFSELQGNQILIYNNQVVDPILDYVDVVIGELKSEIVNDEFLPYKLILKFMDNLNEDGYFIYLIDNDFFKQKVINDFRRKFNGTFLGLIVLPDSLFINQSKSILIGCKELKQNFEMLVMNIKDIKDKNEMQKTFTYLKKWIKELKGNKI